MRQLLTSLAAGFVLMTGVAAASAQDCEQNSCGSCVNDSGCQNSLLDRQRNRCSARWQPQHHIRTAYDKTMSCLFTGPYPSNAPTLRPQGELAFKTHPYVRSPRDFFMSE